MQCPFPKGERVFYNPVIEDLSRVVYLYTVIASLFNFNCTSNIKTILCNSVFLPFSIYLNMHTCIYIKHAACTVAGVMWGKMQAMSDMHAVARGFIWQGG